MSEICPYSNTCIWAADCKALCWFARGERDLGDIPEVDPDVDFVKHFLIGYREKTGCSYKELEKISGLSRTWARKLVIDESTPLDPIKAIDTRYKITAFAIRKLRERNTALA